MVKETREQALKFSSGGKAPDLLAKFAVPASMDIPEPRRARYLKVRIYGMEASQWAKSLADWRQAVVPDSSPAKTDSVLTLVVSCESRDSLGMGSLLLGTSALTQGKTADLEPTPLLQVNDPRIQKLARDIVGGEKDSWKASRKLSAWVYDNLAKKMTVSIPSALDVLESKEGDCNEHATLFCALARAAGIPCRIAAGIVESEGAFYYHAWDLVYVGRWVAVDPTFGQDVADATHIKLIEGGLERQVDLVSVMGRLRIEVLEVR
jgi:transglutaminase-like putative cysteine protease